MSSYPFNELDPNDLRRSVLSISQALEVLNGIQFQQKFSIDWAFDIICFSLKYLEETYRIQLKDMIFSDCMGLGMQAAVIASTFSFKEVVSIELSEDDVKTTELSLRKSSLPIPSINVRIGRMQDYFVANADVTYLDCNLLGYFLDEALFLKSFFQCCQLLIPGAFVLFLTKYGEY